MGQKNHITFILDLNCLNMKINTIGYFHSVGNAVVLLILILNFKGTVTFGMGQGDIFMVIRITITAFALNVLYFIFGKKNLPKLQLITAILLWLVIGYVFMRLTIWRDPVLPWNGKVFF